MRIWDSWPKLMAINLDPSATLAKAAGRWQRQASRNGGVPQGVAANLGALRWPSGFRRLFSLSRRAARRF
jgi:hypothetical protein